MINPADVPTTDKEKRQKEDEIRNWTAEGLAKFGEILRKDNDNLDNLAYNVINNLTNYIDAIQGGFYLLKEENNEKTCRYIFPLPKNSPH